MSIMRRWNPLLLRFSKEVINFLFMYIIRYLIVYTISIRYKLINPLIDLGGFVSFFFYKFGFVSSFQIFLRAFHLSYNMLLNQLRSESGNNKNLLRNSFFQLQANRAITDIQVQLHE